MSFGLVSLANLIELQSQSALLVSCVVLVQQTLSSGLVNRLDCDFVSALGLGAIAFNGSSLELLDSSLQCGLIGLVASISHFCHQNTLLSRLDIRQTKHLPGIEFCVLEDYTSTQIDILASFSENCKHFFNIYLHFLYIFFFAGKSNFNPQHFVLERMCQTQI